MFRDFKFLGRNSGKNSNSVEIVNMPVNPRDIPDNQPIADSYRAPLNPIPEQIQNCKAVVEQEVGNRTTTKAKGKASDSGVPFRTPEKPGAPSKARFGWAHKSGSLGAPRIGRAAFSKGLPSICGTSTAVNTAVVPYSKLREEKSVLLQNQSKELEEDLCFLSQTNKELCEKLEEKEKELRTLSEEVQLVTSEIEIILADGHNTLDVALHELDYMSDSLHNDGRDGISKHFSRMRNVISEKELQIQELHRSLEKANNQRFDLEAMLTEAHQKACSEKEEAIVQLSSQLSSQASSILHLENRIEQGSNELESALESLEGVQKELVIANAKNDSLKGEVTVLLEAKNRLVSQVRELVAERGQILEDRKAKETALGISSARISALVQQLQGLQADLKTKDAELRKINESRETELRDVLQGLEEKKAELGSLSSHITEIEGENRRLQDPSHQSEISKLVESTESLSRKNCELTAIIEDTLEAKRSTEEELFDRRNANETLEKQLINMDSDMVETNNSFESLTNHLAAVVYERDDRRTEVQNLRARLDIAEACAEEIDTIAAEAQEMAERRKMKDLYAEEKEEEVKLLERSVDERAGRQG